MNLDHITTGDPEVDHYLIFHQAPERRAARIAAIEQRGNKVVFGDDFTLQLDIDSLAQYTRVREMIDRFHRQLGVCAAHEVKSKSGNWHVYLHLAVNKPMPRVQRMAWQGFLGSDPVREALNFMQALAEPEDSIDGECFLEEVPGVTVSVFTSELP